MSAASVAHHNSVLRSARARALELEPKLERILERVLRQAGYDAADNFERLATNFLTAGADPLLAQLAEAMAAPVEDADTPTRSTGLPQPRPLWRVLSRSESLSASAPGVTSSSTMVAVKPLPEEAEALAGHGSVSSETMHVTLAYLGDTDGDLQDVREALEAVAASHAPLAGTVGGLGRFAEGEDGTPMIALPDVPGLVEARQAAVQALADAGVWYSRDHGFTAHLTLHYSDGAWDAPVDALIGQALHFGSLLVVRGDEVVHELPLVGVRQVTAAGPPMWSAPSSSELLDVEALIATLRTKTDPVRLASIEAVMKSTLDGAGIDFDVNNPFTAKVLAQSGSQVTEIAAQTQLNVNKIISASYDQGLTIPDTAKAIRAGMAEASTSRATLIARTELAGAVNGGSLAATRIVDATLTEGGGGFEKQWLTADGAVYPRHEDYEGLNGQQVTLDAYFDVGSDQLQFPGDPDGTPEEICNCRCALVYVEAGGGIVGESGPDEGALTEEDLAAQSDTGGGADLAEMFPMEGGEALTDGEATELLDDAGKAWGEALTPEEKDALSYWKKEVGFKQINDYLRAGTEAEGVAGRVSEIDSAIAKSPPLEQKVGVTVFRGVEDIRAALGERIVAGEEVTDPGFISASTEPGVALDYSTYGPKSGLVAIEVPPGAQAAWLRSAGVERVRGLYSDMQENHELVLPRGSKLRVVGVERNAVLDSGTVTGGTEPLELGHTPLIRLRLELPTGLPPTEARGAIESFDRFVAEDRAILDATGDHPDLRDEYNAMANPLEREIDSADWSAAGADAKMEAYSAAERVGYDEVKVLRDADGKMLGIVDYNPIESESEMRRIVSETGERLARDDYGEWQMDKANDEEVKKWAEEKLQRLAGDKIVGVNHLSSTGAEKGVGTRLMREVAREAARSGAGVGLNSLKSAEGFYKSIGMTERVAGSHDFYWTPEQAKEFAETGKIATKDQGPAEFVPHDAFSAEANQAIADAGDAISRVIEMPESVRFVELPESDTATARLKTSGDIAIHADTDRAMLQSSIVHEYGHWIDSRVLGTVDEWGTSMDKLDPLYQALKNSATMQAVRNDEIKVLAGDTQTRNYLLQGREMFARAFEQYVAEQSGDPVLLGEVKKTLADKYLSFQYWQPDEFAPIKVEMERVLRENGVVVKPTAKVKTQVEEIVKVEGPDKLGGVKVSEDAYMASLQRERYTTTNKIQGLLAKEKRGTMTDADYGRLEALRKRQADIRELIKTPDPAAERYRVQNQLNYMRRLVRDGKATAETESRIALLEERRTELARLSGSSVAKQVRREETARVKDEVAAAKTKKAKAEAEAGNALGGSVKERAARLDADSAYALQTELLAGKADDEFVRLAAHTSRFTGPEGYASRECLVYRHNGVVVKIETQEPLGRVIGTVDDFDRSMAKVTQNRVNELLDGLPPEFQGKLEMVNVYNGDSPSTAYWKSKLTNFQGEIAAQGGRGGVTFWHGDRYVRQSTFDHEIGHVIGVNGGPRDPYTWENAQRTDQATGKRRFGAGEGTGNEHHGFMVGKSAVSGYGSNNVNEDWAESIRLYLYSLRYSGHIGSFRKADGMLVPVKFSEAYPSRTKWIEKWMSSFSQGGIRIEDLGG